MNIQYKKKVYRGTIEIQACLLSHVAYFWPFPKQKNSDASKLKKFAGDNFKIDESGRTF